MQNNYLSAESIFLYRGSTFDGCLILKDIHNQTYYLSEGEEIHFCIEKDKTNKEVNAEDNITTLVLTSDDEIEGKYPFKLSHEITKTMKGDYIYYAFIRFADGDYYQIVPHTRLYASIPYISIDYWENKNTIHAKIPRLMRNCNCDDKDHT